MSIGLFINGNQLREKKSMNFKKRVQQDIILQCQIIH